MLVFYVLHLPNSVCYAYSKMVVAYYIPQWYIFMYTESGNEISLNIYICINHSKTNTIYYIHTSLHVYSRAKRLLFPLFAKCTTSMHWYIWDAGCVQHPKWQKPYSCLREHPHSGKANMYKNALETASTLVRIVVLREAAHF